MINMAIAERNMFGLNVRMLLVSALVFGAIAAIFGLIIVAMGFSGSGSMLIWLGFSFAMLLAQWYLGPIIVVWSTGAREVREGAMPELRAIIEKYSKLAEIPAPKLYLVENPTPNAFAFGRTQKGSAIAVHTGLLRMLTKEEVEGVIAHEMGHIKHRDVLVMTFASALPILLYYAFLIFFGGNREERGIGSFITVLIGANIASFLGQLLVMLVSREREYYADEFSALATQKPINLMNALAKISYASVVMPKSEESNNKSMNSFYIAYPSAGETDSIKNIALALGKGASFEQALANEKKNSIMEIFMTHPLTVKRLDRLNKMKFS
jgi:heat shock protein HtpX